MVARYNARVLSFQGIPFTGDVNYTPDGHLHAKYVSSTRRDRDGIQGRIFVPLARQDESAGRPSFVGSIGHRLTNLGTV